MEQLARTASELACGRRRPTVSALLEADGGELPAGVDLAALGSEAVSVDEVRALYAAAFATDRGETSEQVAAAMAELVQEVCARKAVPTQLAAYGAYKFALFSKLVTEGAVREYGEKRIADLASELGVGFKADIAPPKAAGRSVIKAQIKYGGDLRFLCDMNRATLVCSDAAGLVRAVAAAVTTFDTEDALILELEDHYFAGAMSEGYRHVQALVRFQGVVWELQFNTPQMLEAKHRAGHKAYKTTRYVREMVLLCCIYGRTDVLKELLDRRGVRGVADPNAVSDKDRNSALHHAALQGNVECVELLLGLSPPADAWTVNSAGHVALFHALVHGHTQTGALLLEAMLGGVRRGGA